MEIKQLGMAVEDTELEFSLKQQLLFIRRGEKGRLSGYGLVSV